MPPSPKSAAKAVSRIGGTRYRASGPRLTPTMACETAFRIIARRALGDLAANHEATCKGDPVSLHQMRIALTHLRTAILFFAPMVSDGETRGRPSATGASAQVNQISTAGSVHVRMDRARALVVRKGTAATGSRVSPIAAYCARKLTKWQKNY